MPNIVQVSQVRGNDFLRGLLESIAHEAKLFTSFDTRTSDSDKTISIAAGTVPEMSFLHFGEGFVSAASSLEMGEFQLARIGGSVEEIEHKVEKWDKENAATIGAGLEFDWMTYQMMQRAKGGIRSVEKQMIYGRANDPKGFPGMKELTPATSLSNVLTMTDDPETYDFTRSALNVGGTTANTASSVYSVCFGPLDAQLVLHGENGYENFLNMSTPHREWIKAVDPVDGITKSMWHIVSETAGWVGLIVSGSNEDASKRRYTQFSIRRAFNLTAETGKGCSPAVLDALHAMHPDDHKTSRYYMSPRSKRQHDRAIGAVQQVVLNVGSGPQPRNYDYGTVDTASHNGIPIIVTERIKSNEAIEVPA